MAVSVRPLDAGAAALMVILCLSWGFNQVAVKLALPDIPPLMQGAIRSLGALALIAAWSRWRGIPLLNRDGSLVAGLVAGLLFAVEFTLIYRGLLYTTASRAVVFIYTAPFFVALIARWLLPGERLRSLQWVGLALSFIGVAVAIGVPEPAADPNMLLGDLMLLGSGVAWAVTTIVIKTTALARIAAEKTLAYQLVVSAPLLALAAGLFGEDITAWPSASSLAWLAYQTIWVAAITFAVWFGLVQRYSASLLSSFTFLTPIFGVAAGHYVTGDPFTPTFGGAVALVVAGLVLVNRPH